MASWMRSAASAAMARVRGPAVDVDSVDAWRLAVNASLDGSATTLALARGAVVPRLTPATQMWTGDRKVGDLRGTVGTGYVVAVGALDNATVGVLLVPDRRAGYVDGPPVKAWSEVWHPVPRPSEPPFMLLGIGRIDSDGHCTVGWATLDESAATVMSALLQLQRAQPDVRVAELRVAELRVAELRDALTVPLTADDGARPITGGAMLRIKGLPTAETPLSSRGLDAAAAACEAAGWPRDAFNAAIASASLVADGATRISNSNGNTNTDGNTSSNSNAISSRGPPASASRTSVSDDSVNDINSSSNDGDDNNRRGAPRRNRNRNHNRNRGLFGMTRRAAASVCTRVMGAFSRGPVAIGDPEFEAQLAEARLPPRSDAVLRAFAAAMFKAAADDVPLPAPGPAELAALSFAATSVAHRDDDGVPTVNPFMDAPVGLAPPVTRLSREQVRVALSAVLANMRTPDASPQGQALASALAAPPPPAGEAATDGALRKALRSVLTCIGGGDSAMLHTASMFLPSAMLDAFRLFLAMWAIGKAALLPLNIVLGGGFAGKVFFIMFLSGFAQWGAVAAGVAVPVLYGMRALMRRRGRDAATAASVPPTPPPSPFSDATPSPMFSGGNRGRNHRSRGDSRRHTLRARRTRRTHVRRR